MDVIRSPLGAMGALMVLLEAIAGGVLTQLDPNPNLQSALVWMMVGSISVLTLVIVGIVIYFAVKRPGLLFNPRDISQSVHQRLYGPEDIVPTAPKAPNESIMPVSYSVVIGKDNEPE